MSETATFLGYESSKLEDALFSLIPAPYEATATYVSGQALAPQAVIDASTQIEDYDEETGLNLIDKGVHVISPAQAPAGEALQEWVKTHVTQALDAVTVPIIIGGEGSVTKWGVEALLSRKDEVSVLHIDAHADLNSTEGGHNQLNSIRSIIEMDAKVHVCQVGVRSLTRDAFDIIMNDEKPIECIFMDDILRTDDDEEWHDSVFKEIDSPVYVSIDLSALDPSVLPNVGNPEPGGLGWHQLLRLLKKVAARRRIAAIDIVELCPRQGEVVSDHTTAKLAYKIMNYIYSGEKMLEKPAPAPAEEPAE